MNISINFNEIFRNSGNNLIVVEGSNGVGKSTLVNKLANEFKIPYYAGVPFEFLQNKNTIHLLYKTDNFEVSLFYYLSGVILQDELLLQEKLSIVDRSILSTIAYHYSVGNDNRLFYINNLLKKLYYKCRYPNLTIYLDATIDTLKKRLLKRNKLSDTDKIMFDKEILDRERNFYSYYIDFTNNYTKNKAVVIRTDNLNAEEVFLSAKEIILRYINRG